MTLEDYHVTLVTFLGKASMAPAKIVCKWCYPTKGLVPVLYSFLKLNFNI